MTSISAGRCQNGHFKNGCFSGRKRLRGLYADLQHITVPWRYLELHHFSVQQAVVLQLYAEGTELVIVDVIRNDLRKRGTDDRVILNLFAQ